MTVVFCDHDVSTLIRYKHKVRELETISDVSILETASAVTELIELLNKGGVPFVDVLLDRFIIACQYPDDFRQQACDALFSLIAEFYESEISGALNKQTIQAMITFLESHSPTQDGNLLLDFGCGPGLSLAASRRTNTLIVGYERVKAVRIKALRAGLLQLHPKDLSAMPCAFSGGFASFVLHLCPDFAELTTLLSLIVPGGYFVANFHKGKGVEQAEIAFERSGWHVSNETVDAPSDAGLLRVFQKVLAI
ncbi:MAG: hypothetical protein WD716_11335 [Fimbriimonadaceae bacterium]